MNYLKNSIFPITVLLWAKKQLSGLRKGMCLQQEESNTQKTNQIKNKMVETTIFK